MLLCVWVQLMAFAQEADVLADKGETQLQDEVYASILTCSAGEDLYAKFGHTALRVKNWTRGTDVVYNYGCFNYHADNFVWKFLLGETDYRLEAEDFDCFIYRYRAMGIGVVEQELSLSQSEANKLEELLEVNLLPENQEYRYNWLYDNCTERAKHAVEQATGGRIVYERMEQRSVRKRLRKCLQNSPWACFGIDMILGEEIDRKPEIWVEKFLPETYREATGGASINRNKAMTAPTMATLVLNERQILQPTRVEKRPLWVLSPVCVFSVLLVVAIGLSVYELRKKRYVWWFDVILHTVQGLAGVLVAFLFFFSEHAGVDSNWLVVIFNPLALLYAAWVAWHRGRGRRTWLAILNAVVLSAFLVLMMVVDQSFNTAMWLVVATLWVRAMRKCMIGSRWRKEALLYIYNTYIKYVLK